MPMKIIVDYNGTRYESAETDEATAKKFKTAMFENFEDFTKLEVELENGGHLILGRNAIQSCAIIILDTQHK